MAMYLDGPPHRQRAPVKFERFVAGYAFSERRYASVDTQPTGANPVFDLTA
jgi:hypothetical protein